MLKIRMTRRSFSGCAALCCLTDAVVWDRRGKALSRQTLAAQSMTMWSIMENGRDPARCDFGMRRMALRWNDLRAFARRDSLKRPNFPHNPAFSRLFPRFGRKFFSAKGGWGLAGRGARLCARGPSGLAMRAPQDLPWKLVALGFVRFRPLALAWRPEVPGQGGWTIFRLLLSGNGL